MFVGNKFVTVPVAPFIGLALIKFDKDTNVDPFVCVIGKDGPVVPKTEIPVEPLNVPVPSVVFDAFTVRI